VTEDAPIPRRGRPNTRPPGRDDHLGAVVITARDIYDAVMANTAQIAQLVEASTGNAGRILDHEGRLRALESSRSPRWLMPGIAITISAIALVVTIFRL
jgi:hypothetical protein